MKTVDAMIVGAGGGRSVWNFNRYPGTRCNVESYDYSDGFSSALEQE